MFVHICVWRLWLDTFSISLVQFLQSVCLHPVLSCDYTFCTLCLSSFHHDDHACVMLCLLLSTYSAASSSSLRNFLTRKFLSEEFIKIAYSPPSSRYNALSIGIRAWYSLVLCGFGLTAWSFSYVDRRYEESDMPYLWRSWLSQVEGHDEEAPHGDEQRAVDRHWDWSYRSVQDGTDDIRKYTLLNLTAKDVICSCLSQN